MSLDVYLELDYCDKCGRSDEVFEANITHNLTDMAEAAGIYKHLWRPEELGIELAGDLITGLEKGLIKLKANSSHFVEFNPANGWGSYEAFVPWVEKYLEACKKYPLAKINISR